MDLLKKFTTLIIAVVISYYSSPYFGGLYNIFEHAGLAAGFLGLRGISLAYIFFIAFLFTALTKREKYWWIGVLLIPAFLFEFYFDLLHIYFPLISALIGWGIGLLVYKAINKK